MRTQTFLLLSAVFIIVGLFVALFLQSAYVRYRLLDIERSKLSTATANVECESVDNGVRAYALKVACCKTRELNAGPRKPVSTLSTVPFPKASSGPSWLALMKTTGASQLKDDVFAGRVRYVVMGGKVARLDLPNMHEYFSDSERKQLESTFILFSLSTAFAPNTMVVLPWQQQTFTSASVSTAEADALVSRICGSAGSRCEDEVIVHAWAYGISPAPQK
jgi:hypothetical protein